MVLQINHHQSEMIRRRKSVTGRWTGVKRRKGGVKGQWVHDKGP